MVKTNPRNVVYSGWVTWTFDALSPEEAEADVPAEIHPTPLDFAMVIIPILRRFPEAYNCMLAALDEHWPFLANAARGPAPTTS